MLFFLFLYRVGVDLSHYLFPSPLLCFFFFLFVCFFVFFFFFFLSLSPFFFLFFFFLKTLYPYTPEEVSINCVTRDQESTVFLLLLWTRDRSRKIFVEGRLK